MRTTWRALARVWLVGGAVAGGVASAQTQAPATAARAASTSAAVAPEKVLPGSTVVFVKAPSASALRDGLKQSRFGKLADDPAMKPLIDDVKAKIRERGQALRERIGVTIEELIELPQGPLSIALVAADDPKIPFALLISADAGKNAPTMLDVMTKATRQAEQSGDKVSTEAHQGQTIRVLKPGKPPEGDTPQPLAAWTDAGGVFHISIAATTDPLKDLLANKSGRAGSLADGESYQTVQRKIGGAGQFTWYFDFTQVIRLVTQAAAARGIDQQQVAAQMQLLGVNGLKAVGGNVALGSGEFDSVSKTYILAPERQGLLRVFKFPKTSLKPEPWVPATIGSYQTINWDLDNVYVAVNDLANMLLPGVLDNIQQNLGGPGGGLNFQKDIFGPLGNRVTIVSDTKKGAVSPGQSQRMLLAVALEDPKAFQTTLNKLFGLANLNPRKREFQGTTIYDIDLPAMPNAPANAGPQGPVSLAIAKETLFVGTEPTLLEQILRPGAAALADSPGYQAVAKLLPAQTSSLSYQKPEDQARSLYDMVKGGQLQQGLDAAAAGGVNPPKISEFIDVNKIPDFSVIAKYLSDGGGFGVSDDEGISFTQFSLRPTNP